MTIKDYFAVRDVLISEGCRDQLNRVPAVAVVGGAIEVIVHGWQRPELEVEKVARAITGRLPHLAITGLEYDDHLGDEDCPKSAAILNFKLAAAQNKKN